MEGLGDDFSNADDASSPEKARATTNSDASIGDVAWLSADSVLAASDSGAVELWQVVDGSPELRCLAIEMEHDAPTRCVAVNRPGSSPVALSGGEDGTIIVWKLAEDKLSAERRIKANVRGVCGLAPSLDSDGNVFASCARDDRAFLWDLRDERPALALERSTGANCVAWSSAGQVSNVPKVVWGLVEICRTSDFSPFSFIRDREILSAFDEAERRNVICYTDKQSLLWAGLACGHPRFFVVTPICLCEFMVIARRYNHLNGRDGHQ